MSMEKEQEISELLKQLIEQVTQLQSDLKQIKTALKISPYEWVGPKPLEMH